MTTPDLPPLPNDGIAACVVLLHRMLEAPTSQISVGWKNAIGPALLALRPDTPLQPFVDYDADQMRAYGDARAAAAVLAEREKLNGLDTDTRVRFYEHDFYPLSNFSAFTLYWRGLRFDTSEAAYHFEKFPDWPLLREAIRAAHSAHEAFKLAERHKESRRSDWDAVRVDVMREILRAKVSQHEYVRRKLLATGDRELVEDSWRDGFWGWGPNRDGVNQLGKLWMELRAAIRAEPKKEQQP